MAHKTKEESEEIYQYFRKHNVTEVLEAILTGLAVMRPEDSVSYIEQSLEELKSLSYSELSWDMLIPDEMRPKQRIVLPSAMEFIFTNRRREADEDESFIFSSVIKVVSHQGILEVAPELYDKACHHYNDKILRMTFNAIRRFVQIKRDLEAEEARKHALAINFNRVRLCNVAFANWKTFADQRMTKTKDATEKMRVVFANYVQQVIFDSWYMSAVEAKKTREYFEQEDAYEDEYSRIFRGSSTRGQLKGVSDRKLREAKDKRSTVLSIRQERLERGDIGDPEQGEGGELNAEGNDPISLLPIEISSLIFSNLSLTEVVKCALVCRSWKVVIQSNALWNKVDLSSFGPTLTDKMLISLLSIGRPFVVHLNLKNCISLTDKGFGFIAQCRNLQDVNFSSTNINDESIEDIGFSSGSQILYMNLNNTQITDKSLRSMCSYMPHLQYLNLGFCQNVTEKGLYYLAKGRLASQLRHIDISGCLNINISGFKHIGKAFSNLRSFYCNNSKIIDNDCLQCVLEGCRKLRSVSLCQSSNVGDESLIHLSTLPYLTWLRIEGNPRISDRTISSIGERCASLRHFYVSDCARITEISLRSIAALKSLVVVNLADCIRVNDTGVRAIVEGPSGPIIRELNLTNCIRVSDVSLLRIAQRCSSLRYLSLCHLENITEAGLEFIANIHTLICLDLTGCNVQDAGIQNLAGNTKLKQLTLIANTQLTDLGVQKYVSTVTDLQLINVSFCMSLSDGAFKNIAYSCRKLTVLGLAGCTLVGDMTIQYISGACPFLTQLDVSGCVDLTDKSLKFIRKGCRKLRVLLMLYCRNMTKSTVSKLKSTIEVVEWSGNIPPPSFKFHLNSVASLMVSTEPTNTVTNE